MAKNRVESNRRRQGLCAYCGSVKSDKYLCPACYELKKSKYYDKGHMHKLRERRKAEDKCITCGAPLDRDGVRCTGCNAKSNRYIRVMRHKKVDSITLHHKGE